MGNNTIDGIGFEDDADLSLEAESVSYCHNCAKELCVRQKLINMATGRTETMYCLVCLGKRENMQPEPLLDKIRKYILSRQCFQKEWIKYKEPSTCRDPENCLPHNHDS